MGICNKPLGAPGLISYRYWGLYGWIMIGAIDNDDALIQAKRSTAHDVTICNLQIWDGSKYAKVV